MDTNTEKNRRPTRWIIFLLVIVAVIGIFYGFQKPIYAEMTALKLVPEPERFTELYFTHPEHIPTSTSAGVPISFSFTISNLEGSTTVYPYVTYFEYPNGDRVIFSSGSTTLESNASTTINVSHTFRSSNMNGKVVVDLTDLNQEIDFILPYSN